MRFGRKPWIAHFSWWDRRQHGSSYSEGSELTGELKNKTKQDAAAPWPRAWSPLPPARVYRSLRCHVRATLPALAWPGFLLEVDLPTLSLGGFLPIREVLSQESFPLISHSSWFHVAEKCIWLTHLWNSYLFNLLYGLYHVPILKMKKLNCGELGNSLDHRAVK